jgi:iron complex outermembrane receptor protein
MLSKYALDYLSNQITASIDFRIAWKLYNSSRLTYHDRNSEYQDVKGQLVSYKPFWLADTKIYWKENQFTIYTEASNIFNSTYYDFGGIIQPGARFRGGIVVDLDYRK